MGRFQSLHLSQSLAPAPWQVRQEAWQGWQRHPLASPNVSWGHLFTQAPSKSKEKETLQRKHYIKITHSKLSYIFSLLCVFIVLIHETNSHELICLILSITITSICVCIIVQSTCTTWYREPLRCYTFTALTYDATICILLVCIQW